MSEVKSPIMSGWRGNLNGAIEGTSTSNIQVSEITLRLDYKTAWLVANALSDDCIERGNPSNANGNKILSEVGAALGRLIDHPSANNGGRELVK